MKIVKFSHEIVDDMVRGTVKVRGFEATDTANTIDDVKASLIAHLIDENEIREGNYVIEETSTE